MFLSHQNTAETDYSRKVNGITARTEMEVHTTHKLISERFSFSDALADYTLINVNTAVLLLLREEQCSSLF